MSSPQIPATTMVAKAMARALTGGSAVGPEAGSRGPVVGGRGAGSGGPLSDTRRW
jgi:hypothetical protein